MDREFMLSSRISTGRQFGGRDRSARPRYLHGGL